MKRGTRILLTGLLGMGICWGSIGCSGAPTSKPSGPSPSPDKMKGLKEKMDAEESKLKAEDKGKAPDKGKSDDKSKTSDKGK